MLDVATLSLSNFLKPMPYVHNNTVKHVFLSSSCTAQKAFLSSQIHWMVFVKKASPSRHHRERLGAERWTEFATTVMQILLRVYCFVKKYWADQAMVRLGNPNGDLSSVSAVFVGVLRRSCPPKVRVLFFTIPSK